MQGEVQHGMIVWEAVLGVAELSRAGGSPAGCDEDVQSSSSSLVLHLLDCLQAVIVQGCPVGRSCVWESPGRV